jgi:hypothetical protein
VCFSAGADLVGGIVVGAIGIDVARHVQQRREHLALAALPLLFAVHQLVEAFVWWGLDGTVDPSIGRVATWVYLLFAFVVLPVYVPAAVWRIEPAGGRQRLMAALTVLGTGVSFVLLTAMLRGPVTAHLAHLHVSYATGLRSGSEVVAVYVLVTCGAFVLSGDRRLAAFGVINLVGVAVLARLTVDGFASLWCAWAALTSGALALHLRAPSRERPTLRAATATPR